MKLIDHINNYFGTEFDNVTQFVKDIRKGDLSTDYDSDEEKLTHILMFLNTIARDN